jgi:N-acetylmuramoyl-L-alanine amidase
MKNQRNKYAKSFALEFAIFCIIAALISLIFIIPMLNFSFPLPSNAVSSQSEITIVLDAGHGGEDGGCEGNGLIEKDLNLDIVMRLSALLKEQGIQVVLTRETDVLLYDVNSDYQGQKKAQDVRKRLEIAKSQENPILVSIHMNYFAQTQYSGLQVWYSKNDTRSEILANLIQSNVKNELQPSNKRVTKQATSSIFLLHNASFPAILIECGFLSNPQEAAKLSNEEYRQELSRAIFRAIMEYISQNNT